jgi:hypothetical protein
MTQKVTQKVTHLKPKIINLEEQFAFFSSSTQIMGHFAPQSDPQSDPF